MQWAAAKHEKIYAAPTLYNSRPKIAHHITAGSMTVVNTPALVNSPIPDHALAKEEPSYERDHYQGRR